MLKIISNKGFHIKFKNGVTVSVQFGPGNYCEHYLGWKKSYDFSDLEEPENTAIWKSENAEIAIWDNKEDWITHEFVETVDWVDNYEFTDRVVIENVAADRVLDILNWARNKEKGE